MLKKFLTSFLMTMVICAFTSISIIANDPITVAKDPENAETTTATTKRSPAIKEVIDEKTREIKNSSEEFSAGKYSKKAWDETEKDNPRGWTKKHTIWTVVLVAASAVGIFLLVKYSKKCLEWERHCNPDIGCQCLVFEEN